MRFTPVEVSQMIVASYRQWDFAESERREYVGEFGIIMLGLAMATKVNSWKRTTKETVSFNPKECIGQQRCQHL